MNIWIYLIPSAYYLNIKQDHHHLSIDLQNSVARVKKHVLVDAAEESGDYGQNAVFIK